MGLLTKTTEFLNSLLNNIQVNTSTNELTNVATTQVEFADSTTMDTGISIESLSSGVVSQPTYTYNTGLGTVTIGAGTFHTYNNTNYTGKIIEFDLAETTLSINDTVTSYIIASYNNGNPQYIITEDITSIDDAINAVVYTVYRDGDNFSIINWDTAGLGLSNKLHRRAVETSRFSRVYGFDISEHGTRNMLVSAGKVWQGVYPNSLAEADSAVDNYYLWINNGDGTFSWSQQTQYNNTQYDPQTGSLASLTAGEYGVIWVYRCMSIDCKTVHMILGNQSYDLNGAKAAQPVAVPQLFDTNTMLIGKIIVLNGAATSTQIDSAFETTFTASITTAHGGLTGLTGGHSGVYDHLPIYETDGTTPMLTYNTTTGTVSIPNLINANLSGLMSSSLVSGMTLSINADTSKFDISSGVIRFVDNYTDINNPVVTEVSYGGSTANTVTDLATEGVTYIYIDASQTLTQTHAILSGADLRTKILIGALVHPNNVSISSVDNRTHTIGYGVAASLTDLFEAIGGINLTGNIYSANGANLYVNKSSGTLLQGGINYGVDKTSPNIIASASGSSISLVYRYSDGAGGANVTVASTIDPGHYDDDTGGSPTPNGTVANNKFTLQKLYFSPSSNTTVIEYGQVVYASMNEARAAKSISTIRYATPALQFRGWLIVKGDATDLSDSTQAEFIEADKFGSTTSGSSATGGSTTLQQAYNNSTTPEILTDTTRGALSIKRGSTADTDVVLEVLNGAGAQRIVATGEGRMAIGTTDTTRAGLVVYSYQAFDNGSYGYLNNLGQVGTGGGAVDTSIFALARIVGSEFNAVSDERVKTQITPIGSAIDIINQLNIVAYNKHIEGSENAMGEVGLIAQELKEVYPLAVRTSEGRIPDENGEWKDVDDFHQINYQTMFSLALKAIQEQQAQIDTLQKDILKLKSN